MYRPGLWLAMISAIFPLLGCASFSTYQTARTLQPGKASVFAAIGYESMVIEKNVTDSEGEKQLESIKVPVLEGGFRYGFDRAIDAGARTSLLGTHRVDVKKNVVNGKQAAVATGLGLGYQSLSLGDSALRIYELNFPLFTSYDFNENFSLFATPQYLLRFLQGGGDSSVGHMVGASSGLMFGSASTKLVFDVSYFKGLPLNSEVGILQVMVGVVFGTDRLMRPDSDRGSNEDTKPARKKKENDGRRT